MTCYKQVGSAKLSPPEEVQKGKIYSSFFSKGFVYFNLLLPFFLIVNHYCIFRLICPPPTPPPINCILELIDLKITWFYTCIVIKASMVTYFHTKLDLSYSDYVFVSPFVTFSAWKVHLSWIAYSKCFCCTRLSTNFNFYASAEIQELVGDYRRPSWEASTSGS